jgi:hypothetical protein
MRVSAAGFDALQGVVDCLWPAIQGVDAAAVAASPASALGPLLLRVVNIMHACNFQCLLLTGWSRDNAGARRLRIARGAFRVAQRCLAAAAGGPAAPATAGSAVGDLWHPAHVPDLPGVRAAAEAVHSLYSHTLFYFAQVWGNLGFAAKSARYIEATLQRQLDLGEALASRDSAAAAAAPSSPAAAAPAVPPLPHTRTGSAPEGPATGEAGTSAQAPAAVPTAPPAAPGAAAPSPAAAVAGESSAAPPPDPTPVTPDDLSVHEYEHVTEVDGKEWVKNALRLTDYYLAMHQFTKALYCLTAADIIFERPASKPADGA